MEAAGCAAAAEAEAAVAAVAAPAKSIVARTLLLVGGDCSYQWLVDAQARMARLRTWQQC
jgi:hypothetical protein